MKFTSHRRGLLSSFDLPAPRPRFLAALPTGAFFAAMLAIGANAQVGFIPSTLNGLVIGSSNKASKVTSIQFGPDNRLYFTQVNGTIIACDVTRQGPGQYVASNVETISLVKGIPNYDDDGSRNFSQTSRQCTGILVVGTAENPVLYVSSCDPREGAGSGGTDLNLDTNSGIISRLSRNPSGVWEKIDIVRGLPRSEENHASNGLNISADGNTLYVAQGGNTNAGAPSNNFAFACETALAAAILSIDLTAINGMPVKTDAYGQQFVYDIPTLNDPNPARAHNPDGSDVNDPFGGNDGLNQAKIVENGPVQVYASGFRNPYDVLIAKTPGRVGKMYSFDNAGNSGWGGYPMNEATPAAVTNQYVVNEPGTVNNLDGLYLITGPGYYRGHPNPIRANPGGAGWFRNDEGGAGGVFSFTPTSDWPPVPPSMADPQQGDFKLPGEDGALITNTASTTGMAEYTAGNFNGAMVGDIIVTQYSSATVQRISMNAAGTAVVASSVLLNGSSYGTPLDATCPGPGAAPELSGTIFVGHHSNKITVLEPTDFDSSGGSVCTGIFSFALDEDNDGYSNADEITNGSDACSPAVMPPDRDGDFLSDVLDSDDDNDGIPDGQDVFPIDPLNGRNIAPYVRRELFNELGTGFFSIGFTGVMLNPGEDYAQKIDEDDLIAGGTAGLFTDPDVGPGNPLGASNTQMNAFHFGVSVDESTGPVVFRSGLGGLLFNGTPTSSQSQGVFIGNGDQDNYIKVAVHANSGAGGIEIVHEEDGVVLSEVIVPAPGLFDGVVVLQFLVDPIAGTIHPGYAIGGGAVTYVGEPLEAGGKILEAIRGSTATAFGLLATTGNVSVPTFNATWDYFEATPAPGTAAAKLTIGSSFGNLNSSSTYSNGSFKVENQSTGGQKITSVTIDTSTAILPDVVFDPLGTAGDLDFKGFQLNSFNGTGTPVGVWDSPNNGVDGADGYHVLRVECGPGVTFGPGALLTFSSDIDPTSVKGVAGPGPFHAASISGLELIGTTVTVAFDDGSIRKIRNAGVSGIEGEHRTSMGVISPGNLPTPGLSVPGRTSPFTTATQPTVRVVGPAGAEVQVWDFHSALHLDDGTLTVPNGGYDLDPYETNTVHAYGFTNVTIGANGFIDVPMSLGYTPTLGGINQIAAVMVDSNGNRSSCSEILTIEYDPDFTPATAVARVNAGGGSYVDMAGRTWSADTGFTSGSVTGFANPIAGTTDDTLYQTFRFDNSPGSPLDYVFAVPNGSYEVRLHFAETWSGITSAGQRVFDVFLEGQLALDDLDVFAIAGPNTAHVETVQAEVTDGQLTIGLRHVTENPMICGIEVFSLGAPGPDTEPPAAPGVFTFNNLKAGSLELAWAPSSDAVGYRVFRDDVEIAETPSLTLGVTGLTPTTEYVFSIEAFDAAGNVSPRSQLEVTTPADQDNPTMPGSIRGISGNGVVILTWLASGDDSGAVAGYRIFRDGLEIGEVTALEYSDTDVVNGVDYLYEVVAFDASEKTSAAATVSVRPRALGPAVLRVDCGASSPFVDSLGNTWAADFGFNTGQVELNPEIAIAGTENDGIYQSRRHDKNTSPELKYTFPLTDGEYEIHLHFAEIWSGASGGPGIRVFDVKVDDQVVLDDFDMFAAAGFATAHVVPIPVTVSGGQVSIEFIHVIQNPSISAIEIFSLDGSPPDTEQPDPPTGLTVTSVTAGSVGLSWTAATDNVAVTGYQISRNGSPVVTVSGLSHTVTGLGSDTLYELSVVALDAAGNSSEAALVNATTAEDTTAPSAPGSLVGRPGNGVASLSWAPSTDDSLVIGYEIWRDGVLLEMVSSLGYTDAGLTNNTPYSYSVYAVDSGDNRSEPSVVVVSPRALGPALLRVNVGSASSYVDPSGNVWSPDFGYNTGYPEPTANEISGTDIPVIYQTRRIDRSGGVELKYQFTVPNGNYQVRLHFAEVWSGANAPGIRVFDVFLEGQLALDSLDVFAEVGSNAAYMATVPTVVSDGKLTIDLLREIQNPNICGIEIYPEMGSGAAETVPPTAPGELTLNSLTTQSVGFAWNASSDNVGVAGYRIYRGTPLDGTPPLVDTVTGLSFTESGLLPGTEYTYQVVAFDAAGNVSAPAVLQVTTLVPDEVGPSIPLNLTAIPGLSHVTLAWDASTDNIAVTGYQVWRDGDLVTTVAVPGYTDTNLASGTGFDYEVFAIDATLNLSSSPAQVTATTLVDAVAPSEPENLVALPSYTTMSISWSASTDLAGVTGYRIYRNNDLLGTIEGTVFEDSGLIPQTHYTYGVEAIDSAGNHSERGVVAATTLQDSEAPDPPAHLEAIAGNGSVELTWSASSDNVVVTGYEIRRDGSLIATVPVPGYTDPGRTNGTTYVYTVRAIDAGLNFSATAIDSAIPRQLGGVVARVNAGGPAFRDASGIDWFDDQGFNLGTTSITSSPISGTENDLLYQSERYDGSAGGSDLEYSFPVPDGLYEVKLHFAETYNPINVAGQRVFDVYAEEQLALDDLDIFDRVGSNAALVLAFPVEVSDGQINLRFDHGAQNPKICGIEVFEVLSAPPPTFEEWLTGNGLTGQTTGDADGGGLSNFEEFELQMDPNDPDDDLGFRLTCTAQGASRLIALPVLKPIGNYYVHRDTDLDDLGNLANRIDTVTRAEIEAMSALERSTYTVEDNTGGERAFYQLIFEPVAE